MLTVRFALRDIAFGNAVYAEMLGDILFGGLKEVMAKIKRELRRGGWRLKCGHQPQIFKRTSIFEK